ncbi:hypothetical protein [Dyadobacter psychrotolerans]|uniref:hypothetical protein n=1 Tax=Dyadobacter psychrotolerans TaxID=2541721 RepID=UPI001C710263|nr:hypothetical protein [Dyadobacter psychrotolerans]
MGEGKSPGDRQLRKLGLEAGLSKGLIEESIAQTRLALGKWKSLATEYNISQATIDLIGKRLVSRE